jgi:uncharacterized membrane protein
MTKTNVKAVELTKIGIVAALYAVLTVALSFMSYGAIQIRLSEAFNNLVVFNKRYIWAVTLGCALANIWSSLGAVDVVFGTLGTLVMTVISRYLSQKVKSVPLKLAITVVVCTLMMWSVALELHLISNAPFWWTYFTVALGEFISMTIGAIIVWMVSQKMDLTK